MTQPLIVIVSVLLIIAAVIDSREHRIPNWLTYPFLLSTILWWSRDTFLVLIIATVIWSLTFKFLGAGDIKLAAGIQIWSARLDWNLDWWLYCLVAAFLVSVFVFFNRTRKEGFRASLATKIPLAPFMAIGFFSANRTIFFT